MKYFFFVAFLFVSVFSSSTTLPPTLSVVAEVNEYQVNPTSTINTTLYTPTSSGLFLVTVYLVGSSTVYSFGNPELTLYWSDDYVTEAGQTSPNQQANIYSCAPYYTYSTAMAGCATGMISNANFQNTFTIRAIAGYPVSFSIPAPGFAFDYHVVLTKIP